MTEETPTNNPSIEETSTKDLSIEDKPINNLSIEETSTKDPLIEDKPINNLSTEETSTNDSSIEKKPVEVVANPEFISWEYPPYCELCNVYFPGESCSKTHFEGRNHKNRLYTWQKYRNSDLSTTNSKTVLCRICWKEMNTQLILDKHCLSPAHLKEEKGRDIVQRLKQEYKQLKEIHKKN